MSKTTNENSISGKTYFDTEHDNNNNFKIEDDIESKTDDIDATTKEAEDAAGKGKAKPAAKKPAAKVEDSEDEEEESEDETEDTEEGTEGDDDAEDEDEEGSEDSEEDETEESEEEDPEFSYSPLVTDLVDEGVLDIEDVSKYEDSPEGFRKMVEDTVNKKFEDRIKELSPKAQRLLEVEKNGGDLTELLEIEAIDFENIDVEDEDNQRLLITDKLKAEGYEQEEIDEKLQDFEDLGKLDKEAKIAHRYLAKKAEAEKAAIIERTKKENEARIAENTKRAEAFKADVLKTTEIAGIKLTKRDAEKLYEYVTKAVHKDPKSGKLLTQYEIDSDTKNQLKQAYFQMVGYNFKNIETKAVTKVSKEVKKELQKYKDKNTKGSSFNKPVQVKEVQKIPSFWEGDRNNVI